MGKMRDELRKRVLVVDDEPQVRELLARIVRGEGYEVETTDGGHSACRMLEESHFDILFADLQLPGEEDGVKILKFIRKMNLKTLGVIVTGHATLESTIEALRARAFDYITKPLHIDEVHAILKRMGGEQQERKIWGKGITQPQTRRRPVRLIGNSPRMRKLNNLIQTVAGSSTTVLIRGESGTGKELVSRALHQQSPRRNGPMVPVNCGAIPEDLLESELFGHVKGSFTGAIHDRPGRFVMANGGTIFLDEVGDMSPKLQVKILRVLQEQELEPVGGTQTIRVNVRVLAATNVDLEKAVEEKRFREDLYYRLNVIPVEVPPLRDRLDDLPQLIACFLKTFNHRQPRKLEGFSPEAMEILSKSRWRGNVRELENLVERMMILAEEPIVQVSDLPEKFLREAQEADHPPAPESMPAHRPHAYATPEYFLQSPAPSPAPHGAHGTMAYLLPPSAPTTSGGGVTPDERILMSLQHPPSSPSQEAETAVAPPISAPDLTEIGLNGLVDNYERTLILTALERSGGVKSRAAKLLNIKRTTLVEKMKKKNIIYERK